MRIVAGTHRGRALAELGKGDDGARLRPTADRVRESVFGVLSGGALGDPLPGARVLDLFAGSGALGFEALSRGAAEAGFVENGRKAQSLIAENARRLGLTERVRILRADATRLGPAAKVYDLVFLDPPYKRGLGEKALSAAIAGGWLAPGACVVWEEGIAPVLPDGVVRLDERRYGETSITFCRFEGPVRGSRVRPARD